MNRGLLTIIFSLCTLAASGGNSSTDKLPKFTYGAEWSYAATFYTADHYNFYAPEGHRENLENSRFKYNSDGDITLHVGYNLNSNWNLALYMGYTALAEYHPAIPVSLRATRYFGADHLENRWFTFADAGTGFSIKSRPESLISGKLGGGYRISLSRYTKLDFLAALRYFYTHPDIEYYNEIIDHKDINRNNAHVVSLSVGVSLTF